MSKREGPSPVRPRARFWQEAAAHQASLLYPLATGTEVTVLTSLAISVLAPGHKLRLSDKTDVRVFPEARGLIISDNIPARQTDCGRRRPSGARTQALRRISAKECGAAYMRTANTRAAHRRCVGYEPARSRCG
jgi:hypothetical protein